MPKCVCPHRRVFERLYLFTEGIVFNKNPNIYIFISKFVSDHLKPFLQEFKAALNLQLFILTSQDYHPLAFLNVFSSFLIFYLF